MFEQHGCCSATPHFPEGNDEEKKMKSGSRISKIYFVFFSAVSESRACGYLSPGNIAAGVSLLGFTGLCVVIRYAEVPEVPESLD